MTHSPAANLLMPSMELSKAVASPQRLSRKAQSSNGSWLPMITAGRCGVTTTPAVVEIARAIDAAPGLKFSGIQAYQGAMQHMDNYDDRKAKIDVAVAMVRDAVEGLKARLKHDWVVPARI